MEKPNLFAMNLNPRETLLKFDSQLPIYNWYYPFPKNDQEPDDIDFALKQIQESDGRRALYFHIPFCDTICTFCPFHRAAAQNKHELIDRYVDALIKEIELKGAYDGIGKAPVHVISFGGGTPSVLKVEQIKRIGDAIHKTFNLSQLKEWTFELEVKSVTREKLEVLKEIGVNRISFGVQTLNPKYRKLFNITSTIEQVEQVAKWTTELFGYVNIDIIYGMSGQTLDELIEDVENAMKLNTTTIDLYPINNMSASKAMHQMAAKNGYEPVSHATKASYRLFMDEYMRARGYVPVTGFTYAKARPDLKGRVVYDDQFDPFNYHEIVLGYDEDQLIAFGASAFSQASGVNVYNSGSTEQYIEMLLENNEIPSLAFTGLSCPDKGIIYFPFRGTLEKKRIKWDLVPQEVKDKFNQALEGGLIEEHEDQYKITQSGWMFYVNLIYFLMPEEAQQFLTQFIQSKVDDGREPDITQIYELEELEVLA